MGAVQAGGLAGCRQGAGAEGGKQSRAVGGVGGTRLAAGDSAGRGEGGEGCCAGRWRQADGRTEAEGSVSRAQARGADVEGCSRGRARSQSRGRRDERSSGSDVGKCWRRRSGPGLRAVCARHKGRRASATGPLARPAKCERPWAPSAAALGRRLAGLRGGCDAPGPEHDGDGQRRRQRLTVSPAVRAVPRRLQHQNVRRADTAERVSAATTRARWAKLRRRSFQAPAPAARQQRRSQAQ